MWTTLADLFTTHREFVLGVVVTFVATLMYDVLKVGSITGVRQIRNKLSEYSVARLQNRITQLEAYREVVNSYTASDRALYLATLQLMFAVLRLVCMGAVVVLTGFLFSSPVPPMFIFAALAIFLIAIVLGACGAQLAGLNTRSKVSERVGQLDSEIADLKAKLDWRTRKR
jgi:uncharacterized small protein (DUF1192 family)